MKKIVDLLFVTAGLFGLTGVILGALGAHAWEETLASRDATASWNTAVLYHLVHTAALLACAIGANGPSGCLLKWAGVFFAGGTLFFSGSIYLLSLGGPASLGPVTPLGGFLFMVGWGLIAACALRANGGPTRS